MHILFYLNHDYYENSKYDFSLINDNINIKEFNLL